MNGTSTFFPQEQSIVVTQTGKKFALVTFGFYGAVVMNDSRLFV